MELEQMKTLWEEMSVEIGNQKKLTDSLIIKMTQVNYNSKISKVMVPEAIGAAVCFAGFVFIIINIQKLDTWYMLAFGIISALILILLPVLSLKAIYKMSSLNIATYNYKETLAAYAKGKMEFVFVQKLSFYLGAVLLLTTLPVMVELMGVKNPFKKASLWYVYVIGYPLFYVFARWVFKSYMKTTTAAENILKDLEN